MKIVVTGAFSYTGKYITRHLLAKGEQVLTLTNHPDRPDPFGGKVQAFPLDFEHENNLVEHLAGAEVLVNTYWVRFDRGTVTQQGAVENTRRLVQAAQAAGVRRSSTSASPTPRSIRVCLISAGKPPTRR